MRHESRGKCELNFQRIQKMIGEKAFLCEHVILLQQMHLIL